MQKNITADIFITLLRSALTDEVPTTLALTDEEWKQVYDASLKQGVPGVMYHIVELLPTEQRPPKSVLTEWRLLTSYIEQQNEKLNYSCTRIVRNLQLDSIRSCILKGQGCAMLYPAPLRRMPGDIDVWLDGDYDMVHEYMKKYFPHADESSWLHHSVTLKNGILMELHHLPAHFTNPKTDALLQKWFAELAPEQWNNAIRLIGTEMDVTAPTPLFNSVFLTVHYLTHLRTEGTGFKQLLDIYWLMRRYPSPLVDVPPALLSQIAPLLRALSWIFQRLGIPESQLWIAPDERLGRLLLQEMWTTGMVSVSDINSGRYAMSRPRKLFHRLLRGYRLRSLLGNEWYSKPLLQIRGAIKHLFEK